MDELKCGDCCLGKPYKNYEDIEGVYCALCQSYPSATKHTPCKVFLQNKKHMSAKIKKILYDFEDLNREFLQVKAELQKYKDHPPTVIHIRENICQTCQNYGYKDNNYQTCTKFNVSCETMNYCSAREPKILEESYKLLYEEVRKTVLNELSSEIARLHYKYCGGGEKIK